MYPNLYYAFRDLLGVEWQGLRFVNSFGFFVACAFLAAAYVLNQELRRKESEGLMSASEMKIVVGLPARPGELLLQFFLGFILGYKIIGLFISGGQATDPQTYLFSGAGNWPAGIALGLLFAGLRAYEKKRQQLTKPQERTIRIWPHDRVGDMVIFAALFGFLGAKLFHNFENWDEFRRNPVEALLSFSGLTFYGGLICAAVAIYFYARRHRMGFRHLCDAMAPALLLAYAIGRIGCQVAGDGDWGIPNSAYATTPDARVVPVDSSGFAAELNRHAAIYMQQSGYASVDQIRYCRVEAPSWLPTWMVAYNYPNNVINEGVPIAGCEGLYCNQLPLPVFPTPFYETAICLLLTGVLLALRRRVAVPGALFAIYLTLNGLERFLIEKIRVNTQYSILGFHPTQAEIISSLLMLSGILLYFYLRRRHAAAPPAINV